MSDKANNYMKTQNQLKGNTLRIYWYLIKHGTCGVREIQRALHFSSPSTVSYHLNKLLELELAKQTPDNQYFVDEKVQTGILGLFVKIGHLMIPRIVFYLSFLLVGLLIYVFHMLTRPILTIYLEDTLFLTFTFAGVLFFSYECYRIYRMKPL